MLFLAALAFTMDCIPKPIFIQAFMTFYCCFGGEEGRILKNKYFPAAGTISHGVKMNPSHEGWLRSVRCLSERGHVWQANLPG